MMNCLKCQKEYIPKRVGGLFCSASCGNSYRQKHKRDELKKARLVEQGLAVEKPLTEMEQGLYIILTELVEKGRELLAILRMPLEDARRKVLGTELGWFVADYLTGIDKPLVREVGVRMEAQRKVEAQIKSKQEKRTAQSNTK